MVNNKTLKKLALIVFLWCVVGDVPALGLGEVEIYSSLGHPLVAEIPIFEPAEVSVYSGSLVVGLADEATHREAGLPYPYFFRNLRFSLDDTRTDTPLIRVTTSASISEPLFSFLIELRWTAARLLKEVAVLLDPPSSNSWFTQARQEESASIGASSRAVTGGLPRIRIQKRAPTKASDTRTYGPIASGETLSRIASRLRLSRNVGLREMMIGLFNKNPHAFGASMDVLKRGAMLDIPTAQELAQMTMSERVLVKTTKSPGNPERRPVNNQAALKSATLAQFDADSAHDTRLHILSSESDRSQQGQNHSVASANPLYDNFNSSAAQAAMPVEAMQASTTSVELRFERAARDLKMLRAENQSMRNAMANMQNELLVNSDRFEKMIKKYEELLEASNKTRTPEAIEVTLPYATWVPWLTLLLAIGVIGGIGMIGWKTHKSRHERSGLGAVGAKSSASIPLDEILDSVQGEGMLDSAPERATMELPSGRGYRSSQGAAELSVSQLYGHGEINASEAPAFNDRAHLPSETKGGVIAEYLATGEFNITDENIAKEIVNSEGNSEVKLVLLAFYKELGRHEDLRRLAGEILERHPDADPEFLKAVLAIKNSAAEAARRSVVRYRSEARENGDTQQIEVAHFNRAFPYASHPHDQETASEDISTAIYQPNPGGRELTGASRHDSQCARDSDPSDHDDIRCDDGETYRSQQVQDHDTIVSQPPEQSGLVDESEWPELYEVFAPETEIIAEEHIFDDSMVDASSETKIESKRTEADETQPFDNAVQSKQLSHEVDRTEEFAPGAPDPSLLDEPGASDGEVVDTQIWIDSAAQSDTAAHNQDEYDEWFRLHTGSDKKN